MRKQYPYQNLDIKIFLVKNGKILKAIKEFTRCPRTDGSNASKEIYVRKPQMELKAKYVKQEMIKRREDRY